MLGAANRRRRYEPRVRPGSFFCTLLGLASFPSPSLKFVCHVEGGPRGSRRRLLDPRRAPPDPCLRMRSGAMAAESYGEVRSEARLCWRVAHGRSLTAPHWTTSTSAPLHLPLPPLSGSTTSPPKPSLIWCVICASINPSPFKSMPTLNDRTPHD